MNNNKQTILITGGAGFIGANFVAYFAKKYPHYQLINLDKLTYAGLKSNLNQVEHLQNYRFIHGDIADEQLVHDIFSDYHITGVIHFAAESHVDRSIQDAKSFVTTNVVGTFTLLEAAKNAWQKQGEIKENRFHQISTDEVYGSLGAEGMFSEETPYDPRNPYSASKASANMLVRSFGWTHGMNIVISSSSNNYGPRQHKEKLIPTIISNALACSRIPIYGDGQNIRDWLYVEDHCKALDLIFHKGKPSETYNVGGKNEKSNLSIASEICGLLDKSKADIRAEAGLKSFKELITFTEDRLGHDRRYAVDDSKLRRNLGWTPETPFDAGLKKTIDWYTKQWEQVLH